MCLLLVTDEEGASNSCTATVTDDIAPVIVSQPPATITPPDAPISFAATATDACDVVTPEITAYDYYKFTKKEKRVDKTNSCVTTLSGNSVTIFDSGGVGTFIGWIVEAEDSSGNVSSEICGVEIANPGKGNGNNK